MMTPELGITGLHGNSFFLHPAEQANPDTFLLCPLYSMTSSRYKVKGHNPEISINNYNPTSIIIANFMIIT